MYKKAKDRTQTFPTCPGYKKFNKIFNTTIVIAEGNEVIKDSKTNCAFDEEDIHPYARIFLLHQSEAVRMKDIQALDGELQLVGIFVTH